MAWMVWNWRWLYCDRFCLYPLSWIVSTFGFTLARDIRWSSIQTCSDVYKTLRIANIAFLLLIMAWMAWTWRWLYFDRFCLYPLSWIVSTFGFTLARDIRWTSAQTCSVTLSLEIGDCLYSLICYAISSIWMFLTSSRSPMYCTIFPYYGLGIRLYVSMRCNSLV